MILSWEKSEIDLQPHFACFATYQMWLGPLWVLIWWLRFNWSPLLCATMYSFRFWASLALHLSVTKCMDLSYDKSVKNSIVGSQIFIQTNTFLVIQVSLFVVFLFSFLWIYHRLSGRVNRNTRDLEKVKTFLKDCVDCVELKDMKNVSCQKWETMAINPSWFASQTVTSSISWFAEIWSLSSGHTFDRK